MIRLNKIKFLWFGSLWARRGWLLPLLLLALAARHPGWQRSAVEDEVNSFLECRRGFGFSAEGLANLPQLGAATGFWVSHQFFKICDAMIRTGSAAMTRLPMLLLGLAGIWLAWRLGRLWRNWLLGFTLALLLALWPFKATWDMLVRYYGVLMFLMLAQVLACERLRLRPRSEPRFIAAALVSLAAALCVPTSVVLMALPWIYLAWALGQWSWELIRAREWRWASWRALAASLALRLALLAAVSLVAVQYNRGAEWTIARGQALFGPRRPEVRLLERPGVKPPADTPPKPGEAKLPTLERILHYPGQQLPKAFSARGWSPAPLLALESQAVLFDELVRGPGNQAVPSPPWVGRWLLIGIMAGSLALLFISPPLLLAFWLCAVATGIIVGDNSGLHFNAARYYTVPALDGVLLLAAGMAGAVNLARWPLARWGWRRAAAYLALLAALAGGIAASVVMLPLDWRTTAHSPQDWLGLMRATRAQYPGGTLYMGIGAKNPEFYLELARARAGGGDARAYWTSPWRSQALEGFDILWFRDEMVWDRLNAFDALSLFNYGYWKWRYFPFSTPEKAPPQTDLKFEGIRASAGGLGNRVYVTRGLVSLLLRPRLLDTAAPPAEQGRRWRMDCLFEVPGIYELRVTPPAEMRVFSASVAGKPAALEKITPRPAGQTSQTLDLAAGLPFGLSPDWRPGPGEILPVPTRPEAAWRVTVMAGNPGQTVGVSLLLDKLLDAEAPALEWRLVENWQPLTAAYDIGVLRGWSEGTRFEYGVPLRLKQAPATDLMTRLAIMDLATNKRLVQNVFMMMKARDWRAGEVYWLGPIGLEAADARKLAGRTLAVTVQPWRPATIGGKAQLGPDPLLTTRHVFKNQAIYCPSYLRYVMVGTQLQPQYAPAP